MLEGKSSSCRWTLVTSDRYHVAGTKVWFLLTQSKYTMKDRAGQGVAIVGQWVIICSRPVGPTRVIAKSMVGSLSIKISARTVQVQGFLGSVGVGNHGSTLIQRKIGFLLIMRDATAVLRTRGTPVAKLDAVGGARRPPGFFHFDKVDETLDLVIKRTLILRRKSVSRTYEHFCVKNRVVCVLEREFL
jgi:hypothetical protein